MQLQNINMHYNTVKKPNGSGWSTVLCLVIVVLVSSLLFSAFISIDCNIHILDYCRAISYKK